MSMDKNNPYLTQWGHLVVRGTWLTIAVAALSIALVGSIGVNLKVAKTLKEWQPIIIRVDSVGRAQAFRYADVEGQATVKDVQVYLANFCQLFFSRDRYTMARTLPESLYFLDDPMARESKLAWEQEAKNHDAPSVEITPVQVILRSMPSREALGEAEIDFRETMTGTAVKSEELHTARIAFSLTGIPQKGGELINPWGLVVSHLEDTRDVETSEK